MCLASRIIILVFMSCSVEFIFQLEMFTVELTYKGIRGILRYGKVKFPYFVVV